MKQSETLAALLERSEVLRKLGQFAEANTLLETALAQNPDKAAVLDLQEHLFVVQFSWAMHLEKVPDLKGASTHYQQAFAIAEKEAELRITIKPNEVDAYFRASLHYKLAGHLKRVSDLEAALAHYQQAYADHKLLAPYFGAIDLVEMVEIYYKQKRYEEALVCLKQLLPLYQKNKDQKSEAEALRAICNIYGQLHLDEEGIPYLKQWLAVSQEIKDQKNEADALHLIGSVYFQLSMYEEALQYLNQALLLSQAIKDRTKEGLILNHLALTHQFLGRPRQALVFYNQALLLFQELKDRDREALILINMGSTYKDLRLYKEALHSYDQALPLVREVKNRRTEAAVLANMGSLHFALDHYQEALH
ncbi:MAG: tetratricopeptide repeat protein, partial [Proteobacteria bacterium]